MDSDDENLSQNGSESAAVRKRKLSPDASDNGQQSKKKQTNISLVDDEAEESGDEEGEKGSDNELED